MILIADSGSTKTHWHVLDSNKKDFFTQGINPFYQTKKDICTILKNEVSNLEDCISKIYFFGAGCNQETKKEEIKTALLSYWPNRHIEVESDLLGTCFATSPKRKGICCILGTGSNSCLFNGYDITQNIPPLGYILGDEGSGAHLGKTFINKLFKSHFPDIIEEDFLKYYKHTIYDILHRVYQKELPNRYLASLTPFIKDHIHYSYIHSMVVDCFDEFLLKNVIHYKGAENLPIHFTGSISYYFKDQLITSLKRNNLKVGNIIKHPMEGLIKYFK